jgi:dimethylaniline monooxygenase (N-oxide forming)
MQQKKVAVIGAGCSGIVAIKECIAAGLDVVCYEQNSDIGGLWKYEVPEEGKEVHSSVYRNTVINTSKPMVYNSFFIVDVLFRLPN